MEENFLIYHRSTSTHLLNLYWLFDLYYLLSIKISSTPHPPKGLKNIENFNVQQIFSPSSSLGQPKVKSVFSFIRFVILKDLFTLLTRSDSVGRSQRPKTVCFNLEEHTNIRRLHSRPGSLSAPKDSEN